MYISNTEMGDYLWDIYEDYEMLLNDDELSTLKQLQNKWIKDKKKAEDELNKVLSEIYGIWGCYRRARKLYSSNK